MKTAASKLLEDLPNKFLYKKAFKRDKNLSLRQMLRDSIVGEIDAISLYDAQISATDNETIKTALTSIRDEEVVHIGELYKLFKQFFPETEEQVQSGEDEVERLVKKLGLEIL